MANSYIAGSGDSDFDYLIVGTQQGNHYKLYMYDTVGGAPTGNAIMVAEGEGIIKSVRNVSPGASISSFSWGYPVYPIND